MTSREPATSSATLVLPTAPLHQHDGRTSAEVLALGLAWLRATTPSPTVPPGTLLAIEALTGRGAAEALVLQVLTAARRGGREEGVRMAAALWSAHPTLLLPLLLVLDPSDRWLQGAAEHGLPAVHPIARELLRDDPRGGAHLLDVLLRRRLDELERWLAAPSSTGSSQMLQLVDDCERSLRALAVAEGHRTDNPPPLATAPTSVVRHHAGRLVELLSHWRIAEEAAEHRRSCIDLLGQVQPSVGARVALLLEHAERGRRLGLDDTSLFTDAATAAAAASLAHLDDRALRRRAHELFERACAFDPERAPVSWMRFAVDVALVTFPRQADADMEHPGTDIGVALEIVRKHPDVAQVARLATELPLLPDQRRALLDRAARLGDHVARNHIVALHLRRLIDLSSTEPPFAEDYLVGLRADEGRIGAAGLALLHHEAAALLPSATTHLDAAVDLCLVALQRPNERVDALRLARSWLDGSATAGRPTMVAPKLVQGLRKIGEQRPDLIVDIVRTCSDHLRTIDRALARRGAPAASSLQLAHEATASAIEHLCLVAKRAGASAATLIDLANLCAQHDRGALVDMLLRDAEERVPPVPLRRHAQAKLAAASMFERLGDTESADAWFASAIESTEPGEIADLCLRWSAAVAQRLRHCELGRFAGQPEGKEHLAAAPSNRSARRAHPGAATGVVHSAAYHAHEI